MLVTLSLVSEIKKCATSSLSSRDLHGLMYLKKTLFEIKITTQYPSKLESRMLTKSGINFEAQDIKFSDLINKHEN